MCSIVFIILTTLLCISVIIFIAYLIIYNHHDKATNDSKLTGSNRKDLKKKKPGALTATNISQKFNGIIYLIFKSGMVSGGKESGLEEKVLEHKINPEIDSKTELKSICKEEEVGEKMIKNFNENFDSVYLKPISLNEEQSKNYDDIQLKDPYIGFLECLLNMTVREILKKTFTTTIYTIPDTKFARFVAAGLNSEQIPGSTTDDILNSLTIINKNSPYWDNGKPEMYIIKKPSNEDKENFNKFSNLRLELVETLSKASSDMFNATDDNNWITQKKAKIDTKKMQTYVDKLATKLITKYKLNVHTN